MLLGGYEMGVLVSISLRFGKSFEPDDRHIWE